MVHRSHDISFEKLPESIPLFPLGGVLLLPAGQVQLTVVELKCLNMVEDALMTRDRMIGMLMPKPDDKKTLDQPFYSIGCAGRITAFEENSEGRYIITLTGYCRFAVEKEIPTMRGYRRIVPAWENYANDLNVPAEVNINKQRLLNLLKVYLKKITIDVDWQVMSRTPTFNIITFFAMNLPFEDRDKQALLEAQTIEDRAEILASLIELAIVEPDHKIIEQ